MTADEAEVYVYADSADQARGAVGLDLDDIIDAYSAWDVDDFASEPGEIVSVTEVDKLPKMWSIPEELDFRTPEVTEEDGPLPIPDDPRQTKLPFTR